MVLLYLVMTEMNFAALVVLELPLFSEIRIRLTLWNYLYPYITAL